MTTNDRIKQLMKERNWTEYRLAKESGLSQSTIANFFKRNTTPTIPTLEAICSGFGITLGQFYAEGNTVQLTKDQKYLFDQWIALTAAQKSVLLDLIRLLK
ncbi:MAG: helix-turn-helix transcriptional regulator [Ruthenibacterium sp.]